MSSKNSSINDPASSEIVRSESIKLEIAIRDDDLPLSIKLIESGAQIQLSLAKFVRYKKTLEKLARANSVNLRAGVVCGEPEAQEQFDELLAKFTRKYNLADDSELPDILRKDGWPLEKLPRTQIISSIERVNYVEKSINYFDGKINWPESMKESVLRDNKKYSAQKKSMQDDSNLHLPNEYFSDLLKKKGAINFSAFFKNWATISDIDFVKFWNSNSVEIYSKTIPLGLDELKYLLARFDIAVLPGILEVLKKIPDFADVVQFIDAPACARLMSHTVISGPNSRIARQWAMKYPESCTKGVIADAISKVSKDRSAAEVCLRFLAANGHGSIVESIAAQFGADVVESIAETLSQDHRADFMPDKTPKMPKFWSADVYPQPRLKSSNKELPPYAVDAVASMMSISSLDVRTPALDIVIESCDPKSLANFAWGAFEEWAAKGQKDSEWIFDSLSYLGDDTCARKLTPFIRNWPRENGIARARKGFEILAAIGTDVALRQIQAISQKNKYQSVLDSAQEMMQKIAVTRDLKPQQMEDRLVPDLGLSDEGDIKLSYGLRYFIGSVDAQLKPVIKDASGAVVKALPAAAKDDDKALAKESAAAWSELCKELRPVAKLQLERLELAMVNSRRWTGSDFKTLLVASPLLQSLVKGLVWGIFPSKTKISASFIVNAENEFVDAEGKSIKVTDGSSIGILHPLLMDKQSLAGW